MIAAFPLVRQKWTNEHLMAALVVVLLCWCLPVFVAQPASILILLAMVVLASVIDIVGNLLHYKKLVCSVSAVVTAEVLFLLTSHMSVYLRLFGIVVALLLGKHVWGGTGKNPLNPAVVGLLGITLLLVAFPSVGLWDAPPVAAFPMSWLLLPAVLLSLPFLLMRPYAAISWIVGATVSAGLSAQLGMGSWALFTLFLATMVVTDPVTVTKNRITGGISALVMGLLANPLGILGLNILSFLSERTKLLMDRPSFKPLRFAKQYEGEPVFLDLTEGGTDSPGDDTLPVSSSVILQRIAENQVFGMGGAAFPTARKIQSLLDSPAPSKHLIINAVECDPGLIHDKWLMQHRFDDIQKGISYIASLAAFESIAVATKNPDVTALPWKGIQVKTVPAIYPIGAEKALIEAVHGVRLAVDSIPAEAGFLVLNLQTLFAVYEAVVGNKPITSRFLTVVNLFTNRAVVAHVPLGMNIQKVAEAAFGTASNVFVGGGQMQVCIAQEDTVTDERLNYIAISRFPDYKESPQCSGCGLCSLHCPAGLDIKKLTAMAEALHKLPENKKAARRRLEKRIERDHPERCLQCGACSYSCLAGRNLSANMQTLKMAYKQN